MYFTVRLCLNIRSRNTGTVAIFRGILMNILKDVSGGNVSGIIMMTSSNGNIFRVTGYLLRESTGNRWIPLSIRDFFDVRLKSGWASTLGTADLRRHGAHGDVTVMISSQRNFDKILSDLVVHCVCYLPSIAWYSVAVWYRVTHCNRDKIAAIFQTTFSNTFPSMNIVVISLKLVHNGQINSKSSLVQMMDWHRTDDKPLSAPMIG